MSGIPPQWWNDLDRQPSIDVQPRVWGIRSHWPAGKVPGIRAVNQWRYRLIAAGAVGVLFLAGTLVIFLAAVR